MRRFFIWLGGALGLVVVLLLLAVFALGQWTGSDGFRQRVEREASEALGVPVTRARVTVDVFPLPAVALEGLNIQARPAITLERVEARPVWSALLRGRLVISTLIVREAVLPQATIVLLGARVQDPANEPTEQGAQDRGGDAWRAGGHKSGPPARGRQPDRMVVEGGRGRWHGAGAAQGELARGLGDAARAGV
ncbi:MAG: hypothetical protein Q8Q78_00825 [Hydrogenophaga sp.]|nr:hypothetical protein [Hydrogenophaga sp.]